LKAILQDQKSLQIGRTKYVEKNEKIINLETKLENQVQLEDIFPVLTGVKKGKKIGEGSFGKSITTLSNKF